MKEGHSQVIFPDAGYTVDGILIYWGLVNLHSRFVGTWIHTGGTLLGMSVWVFVERLTGERRPSLNAWGTTPQEDGSCVQNWLSLLPDRGYEVASCFTHLSQAVSLNGPFLFKAVFVRNSGTTMRKNN